MRETNPLQSVIWVVAAAMGFCTLLNGQDVGSTGVNVLTWQYDHARTGQNLNEGTLLYNTLSKSNFGQRCSFQVDGQVYSQPLIVSGIRDSNGQAKNVAFVVTQNDSLYAFDATPPSSGSCTLMTFHGTPPNPLLFLSTGATNGHSPVDCGQIGHKDCGTIAPKVGILDTPVIVLANQTATMYLVTETQTGTAPPFTFYHYLHSVDLPTLTENASIQIYPPGQQGNSSLFSKSHIQRPGLLYANGYVYVAFSMMDGTGTPYPNGAVFAYNPTTLAESGYFQTSAGQNNADGAGIWQGGAGLAYGPDSATGSNYLYFTTANGVFGGTNYGDSFVKLNATPDGSGNLTVAATFTPADQYFRSTATCMSGNSPGDYDFGSGGVTLIPPHELNTPYLAVSGDKEGGIWFMNLASPGGHVTTCDGSCSCTVTDHGNIQSFAINGSISYAGPVIHTNLAFWENTAGTNYLFIAPTKAGTTWGNLVQYTLCATGKPINSTCGTSYVTAKDQNGAAAVFSYGVTPSISQSATDSTDAILWAIKTDNTNVQGDTGARVLYAFDALNMTYLYSSDVCSGDALTHPAIKFSVPTVANGYVYVAGRGPFNTTQNNWNSGMFYIFGSLTRTC